MFHGFDRRSRINKPTVLYFCQTDSVNSDGSCRVVDAASAAGCHVVSRFESGGGGTAGTLLAAGVNTLFDCNPRLRFTTAMFLKQSRLIHSESIKKTLMTSSKVSRFWHTARQVHILAHYIEK